MTTTAQITSTSKAGDYALSGRVSGAGEFYIANLTLSEAVERAREMRARGILARVVRSWNDTAAGTLTMTQLLPLPGELGRVHTPGAYARGRQAFLAGLPASPARDVEFCNDLKNIRLHSHLRLEDEWRRGWIEASHRRLRVNDYRTVKVKIWNCRTGELMNASARIHPLCGHRVRVAVEGATFICFYDAMRRAYSVVA